MNVTHNVLYICSASASASKFNLQYSNLLALSLRLWLQHILLQDVVVQADLQCTEILEGQLLISDWVHPLI